jgi:hypothetical protein
MTGPTEHGHSHKAKAHGVTSCDIDIQLTEEAEQQAGGALYTGPIPKGHHRMTHRNKDKMPAEMKGAHTLHEPQYGGKDFFMAPNQLNHLEPLYSPDCGFRVVFYNAFTQPIRVSRFRALIKIIPEDENEPEMIRFLSPSEDSTVLQTAISNPVPEPFEIELYVKFPETEEPELFNVLIPGSAR